MPPTPIPDGYGIATIKVIRVADSVLESTTCGFKNNAGDSAPANATAIASAWLARFSAAETLDSYTFEGVNVLQVRSGVEESGEHVSATAGTLNADPVSPAVAVRITKQTLRAGRKYRGRMYLPPAYLAEANVDGGGIIDSATVASIQSNITAFQGDLAAIDLPAYLLHADLSTPTAIFSFEVRNSVGTQRRRQHLS